MKNAGIEYLSGEHEMIVLPEMAELLPPLSEEQLSLLEADMLKNGCLNPIIVNQDLVIIDGHHRFGICENNSLPYRVVVLSFEDLLEAKQWALDTQKSRRNLEKWELGKIALKLKPELEAKAIENHLKNGGDKTSEAAKAALTNSSTPLEKINTRREMAKAVGIGQQAMGRVMDIDENAPQAVKDALDNGSIKINKGYNILRQLDKDDLSNEEREAKALVLLQKKDEDEEIKQKGKLAREYITAFEYGGVLKVSRDNIKVWMDFGGVRSDSLTNYVNEAREIAEKFNEIAEILESEVIPNDWKTKQQTAD